jgi:Nuclease-related domain
MDAPQPNPQDAPPRSRRLRLRYAGTCERCGKELVKGAEAIYEASTRTVRCIECEAAPIPGPRAEAPEDQGVAGSSARREYEARRSARRERIRRGLGNVLGNVALAITDEPQSMRAWAQGAKGEEKLARAIADVPDLKALHDRRVPHTRGNIDHLLIAPAGVFVVDAKLYRGLIQVRDVGGLFKSDKRLFVGSRDCSHLAQNMGWQVEAVVKAIAAAGLEPATPVIPVLCFVDGEWPLLWPSEEFQGVRLEGKKSIKKLITASQILDSSAIGRAHHVLATAFPAR